MNKISMNFREKAIPVKYVLLKSGKVGRPLTKKSRDLWNKCKQGESFSKVANGGWFLAYKCHPEKVAPTVVAGGYRSSVGLYHPTEPRKLYNEEHQLICSYPMDYNFNGIRQPVYQMGMSVPPLMTHKLSEQIYKQWFENNAQPNGIKDER